MSASSAVRHRTGCLTGLLLASAMSVVQPASAGQTEIALVVGTPQLAPLSTCISKRTAASGPIAAADQMSEGLEFRLVIRSEAAPPLLTITALLKPDVINLIQSHEHDAEAQPEAAARFYRLLRIHVGTRAWVWARKHEAEICNEAAAWVEGLRSRPIVFDRLGPDGEPLRAPPP